MSKELALTTLIEKHYNKIKRVVYGRAFTYNIQKDDLLSDVHYKLSKAIEANRFVCGDEDQFWAYIHALVTNAANDHRRKNRAFFDEITDANISSLGTTQPDFDRKQFTNHVSIRLIECLTPREKEVFKPFFIDGMKYEEVAKEIISSVGHVKSLIFNVRKKANDMFGDQYKSLVA